MPPNIALFLWFVCLIALLRFDSSRNAGGSPALWIPVLWMAVQGSRNPGQWFGDGVGVSAESIQSGNTVDQIFFLTLMLLSIAVLGSRSFNWGGFLRNNRALVAFLCLALVSAAWSDFPLITVKRLFRDLGSYLAVLVILSDRNPVEAVATVLRRISYLLVPLSIVVDKYFPEISRSYDQWTGVGYYVGVTTSKNMLGLLCLVSGLFFFWDSARRWKDRRKPVTRKVLVINALFLAMSAYVLQTSESTTSKVCLALGCSVILCAHLRFFQRRPQLLRIGIPAAFALYLILDFVFGMNGSMAQAVGKDPTLTDRTKIWAFLLSMHTNPLIGTGYQSFWLGSRLEQFWTESGLGHINEAHNGYLEVYLELGVIGVAVLAAFLIAAYRSIWARVSRAGSLMTLGLAIWMVLVFYNMSEAAFETGLLYSTFLISALNVPAPATRRVPVALSVGERSLHATPGGSVGRRPADSFSSAIMERR